MEHEQCPSCDTKYFKDEFADVITEEIDIDDVVTNTQTPSPIRTMHTFVQKPQETDNDSRFDHLEIQSIKPDNTMKRNSFWLFDKVQKLEESFILKKNVKEEKEDDVKVIIFISENRLELESEED